MPATGKHTDCRKCTVEQENAGTSLVEAFSLLEIRTHLQMLQTSAAGARSQARLNAALSINSMPLAVLHGSASTVACGNVDSTLISVAAVFSREGLSSAGHPGDASKPLPQARPANMFEFADDSVCKACGVARLTFEPPSLYCTACGQRIKRNQVRSVVPWAWLRSDHRLIMLKPDADRTPNRTNRPLVGNFGEG